RRVLETTIRHTPVRFIILEEDQRRILQVQAIPCQPGPADANERIHGEGRNVYRQKVSALLDGPNGRIAARSSAAEIVLGAGEQILIVGMQPPPNPEGAKRPLQGLLLTVFVALLFVLASLAAWIMAIRGRLLTEQLKAERTRRAHLEELGLAAAGLAHETKNPLGIISGLAQQILADPAEPQNRRTMVEHILDEVDKATARLGNFMAFARQRRATIRPVNARELGLKMAAILRPDFDAAGVKLTVDCPTISILADAEMLRQILMNLLLNSLHASPAGTTVTVRLEKRADQAVLTVADQGGGIPPELLANIFKPYVAGSANGHGLGLAIVKRFIEEHDWTIQADSLPGRGTTVTIAQITLSAHPEQPE
ncbi:MAG: hypothetical protein JW810_07120, partial [Sedimentisphaerales bacterium]|nr:hypothetical protein [Sedimentisphaerales bacterium]